MKNQSSPMNASRILRSDITARLLALVSLFVCIGITTGWALDGTWDTSSGNGDWTNSAQWNGGNIAGGTGATATFSGASGNTISLGTNSVTVGNLTVSNFSLSLKWIISGGTLILDVSSGKPLIKSTNTTVQDILTIDSTIAGTNGFAVDFYNSRLYLGGSNTFTGGVDLISGTLWTKDASALNGNTVTISGNGSVVTLGGSGSSDYTGNFVIANNSTRFIFAASTTFTLSGNISETGGARTVSYTTDGVNARIIPTGSNSYTGGTQIGATHDYGSIILQVKNSHALGAGTNVFFGEGSKVHDNDVLELSDDVTVTGKTLTLRGRGTNGVGSLHSSSGTNTWAGNIDTGTYSNTPTIGVTSGKLQVSGVVSGANTNGLAKVGDGLLAFTASNTYTGETLIKAGTLLAGNDHAVAGGNVTLGDGAGTDTLRIAGGIALQVNDFNLTSSAHIAFDLTSGFSATQIKVAGDQLGAGSYVVDIYDGGGFQQGTYTLMTVTGATNAADFSLGVLPGGYEASSLSWNNKELTLNVVPEPSIGLLLGLGGGLALLLRRYRRKS